MTTNIDLKKTQFLIEKGTFTTTVREFRRRKAYMLFDKHGEPVRLIKWPDWLKLKADYPAEVQADGLKVAVVWTLVEVPKKPDHCTLGMGCEQVGVCYAAAHGRDDQCPRS